MHGMSRSIFWGEKNKNISKCRVLMLSSQHAERQVHRPLVKVTRLI